MAPRCPSPAVSAVSRNRLQRCHRRTPIGTVVIARLLPPLLIATLAALACWPSPGSSFVYDDLPYIVQNDAVSGNAAVLTSPLGEERQALWRPLTVWTWRLQWSAGHGAAAMRLLNVWLHVAVSLLVAALGRRLGLSRTAATLGALLFAVHPVHTEAVAWVTGRAELLAAGLLLAAWLTHLTPGRLAACCSPLLLALACLSKENALIAPGLFLLADVASRRRPIPWRRLLLAGTTVLLLFAARAAVLSQPLPASGPFLDTELAGRLVTALAILGKALQLLLWPASLRIHYHRSEFMALTPLGLGLLAAAAMAMVLLWPRRRPLALALALVPAALFPVLHLVPIGEPFAERFLYLPSVPFCLAAGGLAAAWSRWELGRRGLGASLIALLLALGLGLAASRSATAVFHDDLTLWAHAVEEAPQLAMTHYNHGTFLVDAGRQHSLDAGLPGAVEELQRSLALRPHHDQAGWAQQTLGHYALGALGSNPPDPRAAARHYRQALELLPELVDARINLASIAVDAPKLVSADEARQLLLPLVMDPDLDPAQRLTLEDIATQLPSSAESEPR